MEMVNPVDGVSRRERERHRSCEQIMTAAAELFARQGYEKTSMRDIADLADMSVGKLYTCFEGKKEIYRQLLRRYIVELHRKGDEACRQGDAPLAQLRCRLEAVVSHFKEHLNFLMIYSNESPIAFEGFIRREIEHNREVAASLIGRAMDAGDLRREDPNVVAAMLVGSVHELMHMLVDGAGATAFEEVPGIIDRMLIRPLETRPAAGRKE